MQSFDLQRWDAASGKWVTFASRGTGIGHDLTVTGFDSVTASRLRAALTGQIATEQYTPAPTGTAVCRTERTGRNV
ncbi:hypothetical protein [Streptomyces minutiscleroticus]|uniref:Uncharacterized protein n=1 Tax=Streptomyces minutiscleroticus TaxID=68238 RepID=A0A918KDD2_9ACTN|nr:hypothetical protein [Streptomyces minutiscleroticus]GGX58856.1 hypothetical protein GCM10010358_11240 [Streptomyces minutiscleroticus]